MADREPAQGSPRVVNSFVGGKTVGKQFQSNFVVNII
jgi:hypothetical protein